MDFKFKMIETEEEGYLIVDIKTGNKLNLSCKKDVQQLTTLLNDWHNIITDKWGL